MKAFNKDVMNLFAHLPDNKLYFINQSMENISDLYRTESQSAKDKAFDILSPSVRNGQNLPLNNHRLIQSV